MRETGEDEEIIELTDIVEEDSPSSESLEESLEELGEPHEDADLFQGFEGLTEELELNEEKDEHPGERFAVEEIEFPQETESQDQEEVELLPEEDSISREVPLDEAVIPESPEEVIQAPEIPEVTVQDQETEGVRGLAGKTTEEIIREVSREVV
ncbi:MAG: hypothetical protein ABIE47_05655, partial [Pseudomonadota bacterium]